MSKITENFSWEELTRSEKATKLGIDNSIPEEYKQYAERLVKTLLQPIRDKWGAPIKVNSCYRCEKLNQAVKGAKNSDHKYACAADITTGSKEKNKMLMTTISSMQKLGKIKFRQLIDEYGYKWIHISINNPFNQYRNNQILHLS